MVRTTTAIVAAGVIALGISARAEATQLVDLSDPAQARELCLATRPTDRVLFDGDQVERAKATAAYEEGREKAIERLYRVRVPAGGFKVGAYDLKGQSLAIDTRLPLRLSHGAVNVVLPSGSLALELPPDGASAAMAAVKGGNATLDVFFALDDSTGAPCTGSVAAGVVTLSGDPISAELKDGLGQVVARGETERADAFRGALGGYAGTPTVTIGAVQTDAGGADPKVVASKLKAIVDPLRACYDRRLREKPTAGGTAVLGVALADGGSVGEVNFIADALGDDVLRDCIEASMKKVRVEGAGGLFRVPIEFKLVRK